MSVAVACFSIAMPAFLLPLGWALMRAPTKDVTVRGIRLAVICLVVIIFIGLFMSMGFAAGEFSEHRLLWLQAHLTLALLGWVGGLIVAVSWQVIPMF